MGKTGASSELKVIVDFVFDDGLLFLRLQNIGGKPARDVSVSFDREIADPRGDRLLNDLSLFKSLRFLAPGKAIDVFVATSAAYFRAEQPTEIRATVKYLDSGGKPRRGHIDHDLSIYADLGYVRRRSTDPIPSAAAGAQTKPDPNT